MVSSSRFFVRALTAVLLAAQQLSNLHTVSAQTCFAASGNSALKSAVNDYIKNGGATSTAGKTYGAIIGNWCVSKVTSFAQVFMGQTTFNQPLTNWNTSSATSFAQMFMNATSFNQPLGQFDTRRVTNMDRMFHMARSFTGQGLNTWQTSRVSSFYWTFRNSSMTANISSWNMAAATDLRETFRFSPFNNNLCLWGSTMVSSKLPASRMTSMFASTNCPVQTSPSFADSPTGPLCYACPAWRWGTSCFGADGNELGDAINVRALHTTRSNGRCCTCLSKCPSPFS
jgi:surface protein